MTTTKEAWARTSRDDQARIDAMTDDERAALREAARAMDAKLAELDATMTAAAARPAPAVVTD